MSRCIGTGETETVVGPFEGHHHRWALWCPDCAAMWTGYEGAVTVIVPEHEELEATDERVRLKLVLLASRGPAQAELAAIMGQILDNDALRRDAPAGVVPIRSGRRTFATLLRRLRARGMAVLRRARNDNG